MEDKTPYMAGLDYYDDALEDLLGELKRMLVKKHHDYGTENLIRFGQFGILVRMSDKLARLANLERSDNLVVESFEDTLFDLAGYALQAILMRRGQLQLPTKIRQE